MIVAKYISHLSISRVVIKTEAAQPVNDWSGHLWFCIQDLLGKPDFVLVIYAYGLSHVVHLATFNSTHLSVYDYSHYTVKRRY